MTRALCCAAALLLAAGTAGAEPTDSPGPITVRFPAPQVEVGLGAGTIYQDDQDGDAIGLRLGLRSGRLAAGLEVGKRSVEGHYLDRVGGGVLSIDLRDARVVPRLLVGGGVGRLSRAWIETVDYAWAHVGGGVGVRVTPRLTLGADLRVGTREVLRRHDDGYVILRTDEPQILPPEGGDLIYQPPFPRNYVELQVGLSVRL